ncbi:MAG: tetratricopeptide repeat protein [Dysgonomonas sp.]
MKKLTLFVFLITISSFIFSQDKESKAEQFIYRGIMAQQWGNNRKACEYYKLAAEADPKSADAFYYWGGALAGIAEENESEKGFKESFDKYKQASKLDPKKSYVYNDWGCALMMLAKIKDNFKPYKSEAERLLKKTEELGNQSGAYNLACLYSLMNNKKEAIKWLDTMMSKDYEDRMDDLSRERFDSDSDFDNIRSDSDFKQFLNKYFIDSLPDTFHAI